MSLTGRKEGRKEGRVRHESERVSLSISFSLSHELPGPRTVGMRSYPRKTSKLRLERLKLFPRTTPENPWCSLPDCFSSTESICTAMIERAVSPSPSSLGQFFDCLLQTTNYIPTRVCSVRYPSFPQNPRGSSSSLSLSRFY